MIHCQFMLSYRSAVYSCFLIVPSAISASPCVIVVKDTVVQLKPLRRDGGMVAGRLL